MASAKLFGCAINIEAEEEDGGRSGGSLISREVSRSRIQPEGEAMSLSSHSGDCNPCFCFVESNPDSGSASMDSEPDLRTCFIDFFNRDSYDVDMLGEVYLSPNGRVSTSDDFNICGLHDPEEEIELGLGIGYGQLRGDSGSVGLEIDSGRVEVNTSLTPVSEEAMVGNEEMQWEDFQNAISWGEEEEELSLPSWNYDPEDPIHQQWQFWLPVVEDSEENFGLVDYEYGVSHDLNAMFDNEAVIIGRPPASRRVVDNLPVVEISSEELSNGNIVCAICKDDIVVEEKVKKLPCRHYYHGECIIPWLGIKNTCPVCRYELPTDDLEYERIKRSRAMV